MNFLKKIFLRPITICTITIVCMALGIFSATQMQTSLLPDIAFPALGITVAYPGASAETCDEDVRPLMEAPLKTLSGVKSITMQCIDHASIAMVLFDYGTDLDKKIREIEDKYALTQFPSTCLDPMFAQVDFNGMAVATVSVYNPNDHTASFADAQALKDKFLTIENVGSVTVTGVPETSIEITPVNGLEITTLLIVQALTTNSQLDIPLGSMIENGNKVSFRNESSAQTIEEIRNTPIQMPLTRALGSALSIAKTAMTYVQDTTSAEMQSIRDELKKLYDLIMQADLKSGQTVLDALKENIPFESIILALRATKYPEVADSVESFYTYINENPKTLNIPGELLIKIQTILGEYLNQDFWDKFDNLIEFKKSCEYENDITGELIQEDITPLQYKQLLDTLEITLPIETTDQLISFILDANLEGIEYDANGNANLNLTVDDVADVGLASNYSTKAYYNTYPAVTLQVYGISGSNSTEISKAVKEILSESTGISSTAVLIDDQSQFINDSISNVLSSMLIGGVLAVIVIYLFLKKIRTSLIIAITMPLSVLCSLICMYFMGITLNMVSLGGLAVGIGMLVDNSIVIIESITFERDKGKTALQAAMDGTGLVLGSLIASTLTSICVFFPILFTKGLTEMIFADMSWSVIFSLTFSLVVAVTVIPTLYCAAYSDKVMLAGNVFKDTLKKISQRKQQALQQTVETQTTADEVQTDGGIEATITKKPKKKLNILPRLMAFYETLLRFSMRKRWLVLLISFVVFTGSVGLVFTTGTEFMPSVDQHTIEVKITYDSSDLLDYCEEQTMSVYNDINTGIENITSLSVDIGTGGLLTTSPTGTIRMILSDSAKDTTQVLNDVRAITDNRGLNVSVTEVDGVLASLISGVGGMATISVDIVGEDIDVIKEIVDKVRNKALSEKEYFKQITDNLTNQTLEYRIKIDKMKCLEYGIDYTVAVATLRAGIASYTACTAEVDGETINVNVLFKDGTLQDYYNGIENFIIGIGDKPVTLGEIAEITPDYSYTLIKRSNGKHLITLSAETAGIDSGTAGEEFSKIVAEVLNDYNGYEFSESGVNHYLSEVFDGLLVSLIVSFILLFAVMACQFESLTKPFIIIFAIPFSFTGGFLALAMTGLTLNVVSFVGIIMLMGVIVNDAIVMVERIGQLEEEGLTRYDAIIAGSKSRIRAIWMTTLTTVLALIPISLAIGKGSELMQPLGVVVMGGLTLGTFVTLLIIPIIYSLVTRAKIPPKDENIKREETPASCSGSMCDDGEEQASYMGENIQLTADIPQETPITEELEPQEEQTQQSKMDNDEKNFRFYIKEISNKNKEE